MPRIEYLGFVIRHDTEYAEKVVAACVAKLSDKGESFWMVYPPGKEDFVRKLFVTSVLVKQRLGKCLNVEKGVSENEVLLSMPNPHFDFILNYLYNVKSKPGSYASLPSDLREAINFFFVLYGEKAMLRLQAPHDGLRPAQIFFWTIPDFKKKQGTLNDLPQAPTRIKVSDDPPQSNPHIALRLPILEEKVRLHLAQPEPWQELYKKGLVAPKDLPAYQISLYGSTVEKGEKGEQKYLYKEQHIQLSHILKNSKKILLTGPSGSGKTTVQKLLMAELLGREPPISGALPIFVSLKHVGFANKTVTDLIVDSVVKTIFSGRSIKRIVQQQTDLHRARRGDTSVIGTPSCSKDSEQRYFEQFVKAEIKDFFTADEQEPNDNIVLFLDGYNELGQANKYNAGVEILQLADKVGILVIATQSYSAQEVPPQLNLTRFELEPLSDDQIIDYLTHALDREEGFFDNHIASDSRIVSMARVPFYLERIVEYYKANPNRKLPVSQGPLLQFFIQQRYKEKQDAKARQFPDVPETRINFVLSRLAHRLIDNGKEKPETVLSFPSEVLDIFPSMSTADLEKTADAAQLVGFLGKSGLVDESGGTGGVISFAHDNLRDYFAALELKNKNAIANLTTMEPYLEYTKWDNAWLMLFGILETEKEFEKALLNIAKLDICFASQCMQASPLADTRHADQLLQLLPLTQIKKFRETLKAMFPDTFTYTIKSELLLGESLSRLLPLYPLRHLCDLYDQPYTNEYIRSEIPWALREYGESAFNYFKTIIQRQGLSRHLTILDSVSRLRSHKVFEFLVELYIQAIKTNSDLNEELQRAIIHWSGRLTMEQFLEAVAKFYSSLGKSVDSKKYISCILWPLEMRQVGTTKDLLKLYHHTNPDISNTARHVLREIRHPIIVQEIIDKYETIKFHDVLKMKPGDLYTLATSEKPAAEKASLRLLELLRVHHNCDCMSVITEMFRHPKNRNVLKKLVTISLYETCDCTMKALCYSAFYAPEVVKDMILSETPFWETNPVFRTRAIIALALCGDKSVKGELLSIFIKYLSGLANVSAEPHNTRKKYKNYGVYLCVATLQAEIKEVKPILKKIAKKAHSDLLKEIAHWMLNHSKIKHRYREGEVSWLFNELKCCPKDLDKSLDLINFWAEKVGSWPTARIQQVIEHTFELAETALQSADIKTAGCFCYATERFKDCQTSRRFLHIFRGWPGFLPREL